MSLAASTRAMLRWAMDAPDAADPGPLPAVPASVPGSAGEPARASEELAIAVLAHPDEPLRALAARLAAAQVARLGLDTPPLGDDTAPGPYAIWLAAAVTVRAQPALACELARLCPPPQGAWDLALRHAVVAPVLAQLVPDALPGASSNASPGASPGASSNTSPGASSNASPGALPHALPDALVDALRTASPLTALLDHPAPGDRDRCVQLAADVLLAHPRGRRLLAHGLAAPPGPGARAAVILMWRTHVLDRLRTGTDTQRAFVLDVYETALAHHRVSLLAEVERAHAALAGTDGQDFERALALAGWWRPLWHIRRAWPESLRERPQLDVHGVLAGLRLHGRARALAEV
jgi:hypothetical protein